MRHHPDRSRRRPGGSAPSNSRTPTSRLVRDVRASAADGAATPATTTVDPLAVAEHLPLKGKRIMITAPRQYAGRLATRLIEAGASPVWLPGVEISALPEDRCHNLDAALSRLESYSHVAFTSRNGVHAVMGRLAALHGGPEVAARRVRSSGVKLCALGADADCLCDAYGLEAHVRPPEASTSGLVAELARLGLPKGARVLAPVPLVLAPLEEPPVVPRFMAGLERIGADAERVPAYLTAAGLPGAAGLEACAAEREMLLGSPGAIDAVVFSSTAEAQGLCRLMGGRGALAAAVERRGVLLAAHGPYTAAGAAEVVGVPVPVVSRQFSTFAGVVEALSEAFAARAGRGTSSGGGGPGRIASERSLYT